jgi:hypothetical protein
VNTPTAPARRRWPVPWITIVAFGTYTFWVACTLAAEWLVYG